MKKTFLSLAALLCILLTAHGVSAEEILLEVEQTRTTAYDDHIVFTAYFQDKVIRPPKARPTYPFLSPTLI